MEEAKPNTDGVSRRSFLRDTAHLSGAAVLSGAPVGAFAAGSDRIGVAIVGCGSRGTGDLINCLRADPATQLVAIGDMFQDKVDGALEQVTRADPLFQEIRCKALRLALRHGSGV